MRKKTILGLATLAAAVSISLHAAPVTSSVPASKAETIPFKVGKERSAAERLQDEAALKAAKANASIKSQKKTEGVEVNNRFPEELLLRKPINTKRDVLAAKNDKAKSGIFALFDPTVKNSPAVELSVPGYSNDDNAAVNGVRIAPPDTNGDVSPEYYVQYVNLGWVVLNKADGSVAYGPVAGNSFWQGFGGACEAENAGDPIVLYDHIADRWLFSQFTSSTVDGHQCVAISKDNKPFPDAGETAADQYYRYDFVVSPNGQFNDYPKITVWPDGYYMTTNEFTASFVGVNVTVFDRTAMLAGNPASFVQWSLGTNDTFSTQPSHLEGPDLPPAGTCNTLIHVSDAEVWGSPFDSYRSWQACVDFDTPGNSTLTENPRLAVAAFDAELCGFNRNCVPQPTGQSLDTLAQFTMYRFATRYFPGQGLKGVVTHTVDVGGNRGGVRWADLGISGAGLSINDQGTIDAPDGVWRWLPSGAMDSSGNIAVIYSRGNAANFASPYYSAREAGDPAGTMQTEAVCHNSTGGQTGTNRWADYASVSVDPVDNCTFWMTHEYVETTGSFNWNTRVCSFRFPSCGEPSFGLAGDNLAQEFCSADGATLTPINLDVASFQGFTDPVTLSYDNLPTGFSGNFSNNPVVPPGTSIAQLFADSTVSSGLYNFRIKGMSGSTERFLNVSARAFASAPSAPTLIDPADGSSGVNTQPTFTWNASAIAQSYTIQIDDDADFSSPEIDETVNGTSFTPASALNTDTNYYWRVIANNVCGSSAASAVSTFSTGLLVCLAPNLPIPDNNVTGVISILNAADVGAIEDLNVSINASHTWVGDLKFSLRHVASNTTIDLIDRPGVPGSTFGCSFNNIDATLDDASAQPVETTCNSSGPALAGVLQPNQPLSAFNGLEFSGDWELRISDLAGGDTGTVNQWCVVPVLAAIPGDLNDDRCVDIDDMSLLLAAIRNRSTDPLYDINGDGKVNNNDRRALTDLYTNPGGARCD
ncbi:hypothetical protein [Permianibacter aggregans]|uniref:Proprotein convertase P-domain-containing protein n=1 Tax=Permianibacter aggregans TaxID=1510150 RepID=A0A4R6URL7_9GAMM|nr:hypothetical protein [Permianibacter aggregans]QGX40776.1 hypothetical protein E2H98_14360 [Permianibacter aggregans]TDQ48409.1 hypothetical protein EV696_107146 [Permianibacter aggregans]